MFFSLSSSNSGLPLLVHCEWDAHNTSCDLFFCCSQEQLRELLASGSLHEGIVELQTALNELPPTSEEPAIHLTGDVAASTGASIVALVNNGVEIHTLTSNSELSGFWQPSPDRPAGSGILIWVDMETKYHVAIAHSKEQACSVVRGLADWMDHARIQQLLNKISLWNAPDTSEDPALLIQGKVAELMHWGSMFGKIAQVL
ncbi:MAG: hypothetical protein JWN64_616 [Parcubacteria group bacterium]|nr:hypothetical protein [Parcubacteria group bacterium]